MELLVVTLAHIVAGREAEGLARIRNISDTIRSALGLVSASFYRSRGKESYYLILTTWEDEECWQKAQEQYNPKQLLMGSPTEQLFDPPEQWLMHYLWGYSRPAAESMLAAAHLGTIRPDQTERTQRGWIECLRRLTVPPVLSFAFLARGLNEDALQSRSASPPGANGGGEMLSKQGSIFLNLLSWASQADREDFYADVNYQAISRFLSGVGVVQIITLDLL
jgi:heme-degrading monooxygenase HmoA